MDFFRVFSKTAACPCRAAVAAHRLQKGLELQSEIFASRCLQKLPTAPSFIVCEALKANG